MFLKLKKILSVFTLVMFLLPLVAEQLHAFEHRNDNHCTNTETHFCTKEHHCALCDFVPLSSESSDSSVQISDTFILTAHFLVFYQELSFEQPKFNYSLRGPPSLV